ncbi:MAG: DUF6089 family protein [Flavobacteriaceae bacterium]
MFRKIIYVVILMACNLSAQENEIGIFFGGTNYIGEIGPTTYIDPFKYEGSRRKLFQNLSSSNYVIGILYRKNFNNRIAARAQLNYAKIGSNDLWNGSSKYRKERKKSFSNTISGEITLGIDFNFFEFDLKSDGLEMTPYIHTGLSFLRFDALHYPIGVNSAKKYSNESTFAIPITVGYKLKPLRDFIIAFEISARHSFTDNLDGSYPQYENMAQYSQKSFGSNLSQDWYVFTGFTLTYSFGFEPCYCPN